MLPQRVSDLSLNVDSEKHVSQGTIDRFANDAIILLELPEISQQRFSTLVVRG
jgi:hypothetical protein